MRKSSPVRYLYTILFYLALPFIFLRLFWRSWRQPAYNKRLAERLGFYPFKLDKCLWVHAVSVGEALAAIPLIKALKATYPHLPLLVTTMTPTGAARVKTAFGDSVIHAYIPYDLPDAVDRFLSSMHPAAAIIMETELWPNLLHACHQKHIPLCLVNARLSEKSARGYAQIAPLTRTMLQELNVIAAHGHADAERFIALGAPKERVVVTGNIKFDLELPPDLLQNSVSLRAVLGQDRFIWIAASTHEGEEEIVLAAHKKLREINPQALLILVPRHPDRFDAIAKLCEQAFLVARRSQQQTCTPETGVYLGDTMGELLLMYAVSDVTFVGGSLIPRGGHNMLEPGALTKPILTGPHLFNFAEISELFFSAHALTKVSDADSLVTQLISLMQDGDERRQMGERARVVVDANRGALAKQLALIHEVSFAAVSSAEGRG
jgi:3-deoxy-D-manno-octulosonic-acid transferase